MWRLQRPRVDLNGCGHSADLGDRIEHCVTRVVGLQHSGIAGFLADWGEAYGAGRTVLDLLEG